MGRRHGVVVLHFLQILCKGDGPSMLRKRIGTGKSDGKVGSKIVENGVFLSEISELGIAIGDYHKGCLMERRDSLGSKCFIDFLERIPWDCTRMICLGVPSPT